MHPGINSYNVITMVTKARIIRIGNSRGIRIPKILLEAAQLPEEVELRAEPGRLIVEAAQPPRAGWAELARDMADKELDEMLDAPTPTRFDQDEWEW
jgi:antitoxin MazE